MYRMEQQSEKVKQFNFPESKDDFQTISGLQDIKVRLKIHQSLFQIAKINEIYTFKEEQDRSHKITATCKYCRKQPSKLVWRKKLISDDHLRLSKFMNVHEHIIQKQQTHGEILKLLQKSYAKLPINELTNYCVQKFDVTVDQFRMIKERMLKKKTFIDDLEQFRSNNYLVMVPEKLSIDPQTCSVVQFPTFLFASSREMVIDFMRYGKVIFLHRFAYLIKKTSRNPVDYVILIISGLDQYANIVFFGFSIVSAVTPENVQQTLINLFKRTPQNVCQTIFTENQPFFNEGVELFLRKTKCGVVHLWDLLLDAKEQDPQKKEFYRRCLSSCTNKQFCQAINQYQKLRPSQDLKSQVFRKRAPKCCMSEIPPVFIGLGPPLSHCDDIMQGIVKVFPKELQYNRFVLKFFDFLRSKLDRYPKQMATNIQMPLLKDCRGVISQEAYNFTLTNMLSAIDINVTSLVQNNQLKLNDHVVKIIQRQNTEALDLKSRQMVVELRCTCCLKQKTGIPCCHIIKACFHFEIPVSSQVAPFWKMPSQMNFLNEVVKHEFQGEKNIKMETSNMFR